MRTRRTSSRVLAGCYTCHGDDAHWEAKNALGVAAQHHDRTGHPTWADQTIFIRYGSDAPTIGEDLGETDDEQT